MNVKLIKMWSGVKISQLVVADVVSFKIIVSDRVVVVKRKLGIENVIIKNPIVALPTSQGTLGFAPGLRCW